MVRHSLRYVLWKERKAVAADLKVIYAAATLEEAEAALESFAERWDKEYPTISTSWRNNWERITPFFAYPKEIRKVIYTTNAIESLNHSLRKVTKKKRGVPKRRGYLEIALSGATEYRKEMDHANTRLEECVEPLYDPIPGQDANITAWPVTRKKSAYSFFDQF